MDAPFLVDSDDKDVELSGGAKEGPRRAWWNWQVHYHLCSNIAAPLLISHAFEFVEQLEEGAKHEAAKHGQV